MSELELKPCPGCGSAATTREVSSPELVGACSECSFAAFITDWNTRAAAAVEWQDEYEKLLQFFGAEVKENGDLSIDMKKYHAAHLCQEHSFQPWKRAEIEERCVLCLQADLTAAKAAVGRPKD